jgi:hypothetical protein
VPVRERDETEDCANQEKHNDVDVQCNLPHENLQGHLDRGLSDLGLHVKQCQLCLTILNVHNPLHAGVYDFTLGWCSGSWGCAGAVSNRLMATVKVGVGVPQAAMLVTHWVSQVLAPADDLNARAPLFTQT